MKPSEYDLKIDLHVHSPASFDYLGDKSSHGYAALVEAFVNENVDVIALTDHNTISGYIEYSKQVELSRETYRLMAARDDKASIVQELKSEVERFDKLLVFPGIEISAYPNVHLIFIFDISVVTKVPIFLTEMLDFSEALARGDQEHFSKHSPVAILDLATTCFGDRFFCVLPHVESSKGAWTELDGLSRAELFRDERVVAAQFSNPDTLIRISKVLVNDPYKRKNPLGFIQCSDYHGAPNIPPASQFTILKVNKQLDFESLRRGLADSRSLRCSNEFVEERLRKSLDGRPQVRKRPANHVYKFCNG